MAKTVSKTVKMRPGRNGGQLLDGPGPGRPPGETPKSMIQDLYSQGEAEGLRKMCDAMYRRALKGDVNATRLLWEYGHGKPSQPITGEEGGPIEVEVKFPEI